MSVLLGLQLLSLLLVTAALYVLLPSIMVIGRAPFIGRRGAVEGAGRPPTPSLMHIRQNSSREMEGTTR
jgi:hypothetical protein